MAYTYETGNTSASGSKNFIDKIKAFAETIGWTILVHTSEDQVAMKCAGEAGDEEDIYIGFKIDPDDSDSRQIRNYIFTSFDVSKSFENQAVKTYKISLGDDTGIKYWLFGDKDHIKYVLRTSGDYSHGYAGFINRYNTKLSDPYPSLAGGMSYYDYAGGTHRYSYWRWEAYMYSSVGFLTYYGAAKATWMQDIVQATPHFSDKYIAFELFMYKTGEAKEIRGYLKDMYYVSGDGLSSEDTVTISGITYIVFQDGRNNSIKDFVMIKKV